jgi:protein MpaA
MRIYQFGQTSKNLPIFAYEFGVPDANHVLILGGVHGDEIEGVITARDLLSRLMKNPSHFDRMKVTLVPELNPEGVLHKTRGNLNGVDLNRNLPTRDWSAEIKTPRYHPGPSPMSEPENQALCAFISKHPLKFILSLHSWNPMLNINGDCLEEAEILAALTGYRIDRDIGYPTPGSLGTYGAAENGIPTITYEIERGQKQEDILKMHPPAIWKLLEHLNQKF